MATYKEIFDLRSDSALLNRVTVACAVAAEDIRATEPADTAERLAWARATFKNPASAAKEMYPMLLAANKDLTVAQIQSATDAAIQAKVDAAVDLFAGS